MDYEMAIRAKALESRFEGRLFTEEGRLYFVVEVDSDGGFARVSYRENGEQLIKQMPIADVGLRLASSSKLMLDGLSSPETSSRIIEQSDGWYFSARGGLQGPHASEDEANQALGSFILAEQSKARTARRRRDD